MQGQAPGKQGARYAHQSLKGNVRTLKGVGGFLIAMGIGAIALLNAQPHFALAREIAKEIEFVPLLEWLIQLTFVGGWILFITVNAIALLGLLLWAFTQYFQILPLMVDNPSKRLQTYRGLAYGYEAFICFIQYPPYQGGATTFLEDFWYWDFALIDWWNLALFLVMIGFFEIAVVTAVEVNKAFTR